MTQFEYITYCRDFLTTNEKIPLEMVIPLPVMYVNREYLLDTYRRSKIFFIKNKYNLIYGIEDNFESILYFLTIPKLINKKSYVDSRKDTCRIQIVEIDYKYKIEKILLFVTYVIEARQLILHNSEQ